MLVDYTKRYEKVSIVASILMIILSIFLMFKPENTISIIVIVFGLIVMVDGIIHIINYFKIDPTQKLMSFELVEGLIELFAGAVITICADALVTFLPIMFAIWIILKGLITFQMSLNVKTIPNSGWGWMFIISIIGIIIGFVIMFNPFASILTITTLVGLALLITEVLNLIDASITLYKLKGLE